MAAVILGSYVVDADSITAIKMPEQIAGMSNYRITVFLSGGNEITIADNETSIQNMFVTVKQHIENKKS